MAIKLIFAGSYAFTGTITTGSEQDQNFAVETADGVSDDSNAKFLLLLRGKVTAHDGLYLKFGNISASSFKATFPLTGFQETRIHTKVNANDHELIYNNGLVIPFTGFTTGKNFRAVLKNWSAASINLATYPLTLEVVQILDIG